MSELDYSDFVNVKITKVLYDNEPSHWELDIKDNQDASLGEATASNIHEIFDIAYSVIYGDDKSADYKVNNWATFDANKDSK